MNGKGVHKWKGESVYSGFYVNGNKHGKGLYTWANGKKLYGKKVYMKKLIKYFIFIFLLGGVFILNNNFKVKAESFYEAEYIDNKHIA